MYIKMKDIYGTEVEIQESVSGYFRMDFTGKQFLEEDDGLGNTIPCCVSFDIDKARVFQAALNEFFEEN